MLWRRFEGALAGNVNHHLRQGVDLPSASPRCLGGWRGAPAGVSVCFSRAFRPATLCAASPVPSRLRCCWRREEKLLTYGKALCGWGRQGRISFCFIYFLFYYYFFILHLVVVLLREGSNLTSVETNDAARLPRCLLLLRQKRCHYFSPFVLDFCEPKGLEDFNGLSQRLRGPLYVKPQSHPRLCWPLFDFMKLILDRWYFYSSCLASPMAILM